MPQLPLTQLIFGKGRSSRSELESNWDAVKEVKRMKTNDPKDQASAKIWLEPIYSETVHSEYFICIF